MYSALIPRIAPLGPWFSWICKSDAVERNDIISKSQQMLSTSASDWAKRNTESCTLLSFRLSHFVITHHKQKYRILSRPFFQAHSHPLLFLATNHNSPWEIMLIVSYDLICCCWAMPSIYWVFVDANEFLFILMIWIRYWYCAVSAAFSSVLLYRLAW